MNNNYKLQDIETDITLNSNIKDIFFNQLKNRDFKYSLLDSDIIVNVNLFLPINSEYPFTFRIDTENNIIIPQYTKTHRIYIPSKEELIILKDTINYVNNKIAHPRKAFSKDKTNIYKSNFIGKFSGIKSRDANNSIIFYELPKSFNDLDSSIFLDNKEKSSIKNIYVYIESNDSKENIAFIKLFSLEQYRILINPKYESVLDINISFTDNNINLKLILSDSVNVDSVSLICKG